MSWPVARFEDLYSEPSKNGVYKEKQFHGKGVRIVNMGELFAHDVISDQEMKRLVMSDAEMSRCGLANGDLLFGRRSLIESGAGKCSIVEGLSEETTFESSIIRVRVDEEKVRPRFLFYWLKSHQGRGVIRSIVTGTNVKGIKSSVLKNILIPFPKTKTQDRIVEQLKAYDDLIENNRRRIQLLEQSARLLYKEWFVHLRFPGHEHVKIKNGVPEGWMYGCIGNLAEVKSGYAFKSKDWQTEGFPVIKIKNVVGDGTIDTVNCDHVSEEVAEKAGKFSIPLGTLLIAMTGATVGKVGLMSDSSRTFYLNQRVGLFKSKCGDPIERFLIPFFQETDAQTQVTNLAGGAAQPNISGGQIESVQLLIPDRKILNLYLGNL